MEKAFPATGPKSSAGHKASPGAVQPGPYALANFNKMCFRLKLKILPVANQL